MKKFIALALCLSSLTGCKPGSEKAIELAKNEITADMKDPDSAKFRYLRFIKAGEKDGEIGGFICGNVNAKNSYGAYAGFSPFFVTLRMRSKGYFSKGVTYKVDDKKIYSHATNSDLKAYQDVCGPDQ